MKKSVMGETPTLLKRVEEILKSRRVLEEEKKKNQKETRVSLVVVPHLPEDCIFNILVRLPLESLLVSRFVCKGWCKIVNRLDFVDAHLKRADTGLIYLGPAAKGCSPATCKIEFNVDAKVSELVSIPLLHWQLFNPRKQFQIKYLEIKGGKSTTKEYNVTCTGHIKATCNGLIVLENLVKVRGLIVMNPVTRVLKTVPLGTMCSPHRESYGLAFCHDSSVYKLVHLFQDTSGYIGCEVMCIGGRQWRVVDGPTDGSMVWLGYQPVFAIGALHWLPRVDHNEYIVSMALKDERFKEVPLPKTAGIHDRVLDIDGGSVLGFVTHPSPDKIDVWILSGLGIGKGWAKWHSIAMDCARDMVPLCCVAGGRKLVFKHGSDLYYYDPHLQAMKKIEVNDEWCRSPSCYFPHVNSLISSKIKH